MWETWVRSLGWEDPLEKGIATHSSILAWRIPMDREITERKHFIKMSLQNQQSFRLVRKPAETPQLRGLGTLDQNPKSHFRQSTQMESKGWSVHRERKFLTRIACTTLHAIFKGQFALINSHHNIQEQGNMGRGNKDKTGERGSHQEFLLKRAVTIWKEYFDRVADTVIG